jgi:hypothetical protein
MTMHHHHHNVIHLVLVRLSALSPEEIKLEEIARYEPLHPFYRARCGERWTYVDRPLAVRLRENGAEWVGDLLRDPCAVA